MARIVAVVSNPCSADARVIKMARAAQAAGHEVHVVATLADSVAPLETVAGVTFHSWSGTQVKRSGTCRFWPRSPASHGRWWSAYPAC
jgi:hypothetical protein